MNYEYKKYNLNKKRKKRKWLWFFAIVFFGFFGLMFLKTGFTVNQITNMENGALILPIGEGRAMPKLPEKDPDRTNILLLGMRDSNESGDGKLLTDTMILLSYNQKTNKAALISIPRDLYVEIWGLWEKKKINSAYVYAGVEGTKNTVALTTGQYVDHLVNVNFHALTQLVDNLGGITVYLNYPFEESLQWIDEGWEGQYWIKEELSTTTDEILTEEDVDWDEIEDEEERERLIKEINRKEKWVFQVPAGTNVLDGASALYYARSRFSSSDFDRIRRQHQVITAIKDKALSLGVLANPVKIYNLLDLLGKNVKTDMSLSEIKELINQLSQANIENMKIGKVVFDDNEEDGLLYHAFVNEEYVLLPVNDSFQTIREVCEGVVN